MAGVVCGSGVGALAAPDALTAVRSRRVEIVYRLLDTTPDAHVQIWYTRDRALSWARYQEVDESANPAVFEAPAEGLYGISLVVAPAGVVDDMPPAPGSQPQRWVFIDETPPLAQWDAVVPGDAFSSQRVLELRWTAHDDHLPARPVTLAYESSIEQQWRIIDDAIPNTGRYDWHLPQDASGRITIRLSIRDLGGHVVERLYGPIAVDQLVSIPESQPAGSAVVASPQPPGLSTQPAATASAPAGTMSDLANERRAEELHRRGSWHLTRGEYAQAVERFREALEIDPTLSAAETDLAYTFYLQQDYSKAIEHYRSVLARNNRSVNALRGAALAYVATKDYPHSRELLQRRLTINNKDAEAWLDLGDVLFMMGDPVTARSHWEEACRVDASAEEIIRKARRRLDRFAGQPSSQADNVASGR